MGRVLILEPDAEVRELIRRVVSRLGHEPLAPARMPAHIPAALDAVVLEPAWEPALELARRLREGDPKLPVVFESIEPWTPEFESLRPLRYLVKPFGLRELEEAIQAVGAD
jgi:DNA-binding response OmpR family regulator